MQRSHQRHRHAPDYGHDLYGGGLNPYAEMFGAIQISAVADPLGDEPIQVPPGDFSKPYIDEGKLAYRAGEAAEIVELTDGFAFTDDGDNFSYLTGYEPASARVVDEYGNPVANAKVNIDVGGGGKVMSTMAMWCRDNVGDPFAWTCPYDGAAVQSTEVPAVLDVKGHYGSHDCGECELIDGAIVCPSGWTPDDQCDQVTWWSGSDGRASANWIMGPPGGQSLTFSLPDHSEVDSITISGSAIDLAAHDTLAVGLNLAHRRNNYTQYAGQTMTYPFRVVVLYRHDESANPNANPLVRVDDDLPAEDMPEGKFSVYFDVEDGGISESPVRTGNEPIFLELQLTDGESDPTDMA